MKKYNNSLLRILSILFVCVLCANNRTIAQSAQIKVNLDKQGAKVSSSLHGAFFEEISHAGDGGLYAELIQNRGFEDANIPQGDTLNNGWLIPPRTPSFQIQPRVSNWRMQWKENSKWPGWSMSNMSAKRVKLKLVNTNPLSPATPHSLEINIKSLDKNGQADLINKGYWGINVEKGDTFLLKFYLRADKRFRGPIDVYLQSKNGMVLGKHVFYSISQNSWQEYRCNLVASGTDPKAEFGFSFEDTGRVWLDFVSLFPSKTFMNRENGLRPDLAQKISDLKPAFIRWPGGCYVEGINVQSAFNWKNSIGPLVDRPETYSPWGYWSTNGFGFYEFLQYCEDIHASALLVVSAGISDEFQSGTFYPDDSIPSLIQSALDAIQYAIGPVTSKWGKMRAAAGHPNPFPLKYIEVGNEHYGPNYALRYNQFYKAIKSKYPEIGVIASMGMGSVNHFTLNSIPELDIADEHSYKPVLWSMRNSHFYDSYPRKDWKLYIGEYACNSGVGSGNMYAALNDAVFIMDLERNSDLITMSSYAPLLANINQPDWGVNLINFDNNSSYGSISYYVIKMFNQNRPDVNLSTLVEINKPKKPRDSFKGSVGISTWDTYTSFKDIQIVRNGEVKYTSDFKTDSGNWIKSGGFWKLEGREIQQKELGAWPIAYLKNVDLGTYTLYLKARKDSGTNAFMIPFAIKDEKNYLRINIGAWINTVTTVEMVSDGSDAIISKAVKLPEPIVNGKWYNVKLVVNPDSVSCFMDGKLLITYKEPRKFFAIAGRDTTTGNIIIKVVNAFSSQVPCKISLIGLNKKGAGKTTLSTIATNSVLDKNTITNPKSFIPVTTDKKFNESGTVITLKPYSINVLKINMNEHN